MLAAMWAPLREIMLSILIGALAGFLLCQLVRKLQNSRDMLIIVFGVVLVAAGLSVRWHLSLILTNLVVGLVLSNTRHESVVNRVTAPLREIMPLLFLLFFCLAGAHLQLSALPGLGLVGVVYIFGRSAGLIGGARLGAMFGKVDENVKKYVGLGILSQAGVAIGLSLILKQDLDQLGTERACWIGASVLTSITATCIFFEVVGPILTRIALKKAGEIPEDTLKQIS